jgi:hypothetical protein
MYEEQITFEIALPGDPPRAESDISAQVGAVRCGPWAVADAKDSVENLSGIRLDTRQTVRYPEARKLGQSDRRGRIDGPKGGGDK